jgi:hypothetical protein
MFGSFGSFRSFGFPGFFPGFGFGGILPSYIPYLASTGLGRCNCPDTLQLLPPFLFTGVIQRPVFQPFSVPFLRY